MKTFLSSSAASIAVLVSFGGYAQAAGGKAEAAELLMRGVGETLKYFGFYEKRVVPQPTWIESGFAAIRGAEKAGAASDAVDATEKDLFNNARTIFPPHAWSMSIPSSVESTRGRTWFQYANTVQLDIGRITEMKKLLSERDSAKSTDQSKIIADAATQLIFHPSSPGSFKVDTFSSEIVARLIEARRSRLVDFKDDEKAWSPVPHNPEILVKSKFIDLTPWEKTDRGLSVDPLGLTMDCGVVCKIGGVPIKPKFNPLGIAALGCTTFEVDCRAGRLRDKWRDLFRQPVVTYVAGDNVDAERNEFRKWDVAP